jgi:hypothetical protein
MGATGEFAGCQASWLSLSVRETLSIMWCLVTHVTVPVEQTLDQSAFVRFTMQADGTLTDDSFLQGAIQLHRCGRRNVPWPTNMYLVSLYPPLPRW